MSPMRPLAAAVLTIAAGVSCAGCQNQPSHVANPLYSADRVPPPSTRALAPGSAQPYYSGDPLPVIPSGPAASPGQSSATETAPAKPLDWTSPSTVSVPAPAMGVANTPQMAAPSATNSSGSPAGWWDAPLKSASSQEVLPVAWSEMPPTSTPPRVRLPHTQVVDMHNSPPQPSVLGAPAPGADGFRPRGIRSAPY